jgi:hypothetical protein
VPDQVEACGHVEPMLHGSMHQGRTPILLPLHRNPLYRSPS